VDLISAITTESIQYNGLSEPWDPWLTSVRVLYNSIISYLPDPEDRDILTRIFVDEDRSARALVGRLSSRARDIYGALEDRDPERILAFWGDVSPQDVATLRKVSPSTSVQALDADLFIMHDRSDPFIPYVESRRLAASPDGAGRGCVDCWSVRAYNQRAMPAGSDLFGLRAFVRRILYGRRRARTCRYCGRAIYWRRSPGGSYRPVNGDGSMHVDRNLR